MKAKSHSVYFWRQKKKECIFETFPSKEMKLWKHWCLTPHHGKMTAYQTLKASPHYVIWCHFFRHLFFLSCIHTLNNIFLDLLEDLFKDLPRSLPQRLVSRRCRIVSKLHTEGHCCPVDSWTPPSCVTPVVPLRLSHQVCKTESLSVCRGSTKSHR